MKIEQHIRFPCGYESDTIITSGLFSIYSLSMNDELKECPIHGKNCPINMKGGSNGKGRN
jgi:hypothetical protein